MTPERSGSDAADSPSVRRVARLPLWVRIAVPIAVVVVAAAIIVLVVTTTRSTGDPDTAMRELCRAAAEEQLEGRGVDDIEVSAAAMRVTASGDAYRVEGTARFTDDGAQRTENLRCTIRDDGGGWRIAAVRVSG